MSFVWASGRRDVWATSFQAGGLNSQVWHFDGSSWSPVLSLASRPGGLWGTAADDVWVGTGAGDAMHWDGTSWTRIPTPSSAFGGLAAIWGSAKNDVWAAGGYGGLLHWDGAQWSVSTMSGQYTALAVHAPNDVWAVGYGPIAHWDGKAWTSSTVHGGTPGSAAFALPDGTVWIGGGIDLLRRTP
jgi:hypothetical protein